MKGMVIHMTTPNLILGICVALAGLAAGAFVAIGDVNQARQLIAAFLGTFLGHTTATVSKPNTPVDKKS